MTCFAGFLTLTVVAVAITVVRADDAIEDVVKWNAGADVSTLAGRTVRLRFAMRDADQYSIRFRD